MKIRIADAHPKKLICGKSFLKAILTHNFGFIYHISQNPIKQFYQGGFLMLLFTLLFSLFQGAILFCCLAAKNTPASREVSDREQLDFIKNWAKNKH
ncbi:MAG: hypothetical protein Q4C91_06040 [Eubacteriales bacterium]|nr:hypothetical protein [Eubacteriales bacterium]